MTRYWVRFFVDTSSLMDTGYSLLMDSRSATNAKKLLASADFQVHIQPITSVSFEPQVTITVELGFILIFMVDLFMKHNWLAA